MQDDLIAELMQRCDTDGVLRALERLTIGEPVRLPSGAFANFVVRIEHIDENEGDRELINIRGPTNQFSVRQDELKVTKV